MTHHQIIQTHGHENVQATHGSTLEVTSDDWLTSAGDCIIAVEATPVPAEFDSAYKRICQDSEATVRAHIEVSTDEEIFETVIEGRGDPGLTLTDNRSAVIRTSEYIDDRTVMIDADTAATDLDRELVSALSAGASATITLSVDK
jgi:Uncharacterized protein conserved in archaea